MALAKKLFVCTVCHNEYPQWQGKCVTCKSWNSLQEKSTQLNSKNIMRSGRLESLPQDFIRPTALSEIKVQKELRFSCGFGEFDRVLGGGLVAGSVILIGGNPGAGKSTLLLQSMASLGHNKSVCYVSGEESINQLVLHSLRLGISKENISLLAENRLENILAAVYEMKPQVLVVDSIQTIYSAEQSSMMGGISQVRECAARLMEYAKQSNCAVLMIGHVTKEGTLAGPRVLEHIVDVSLVLESTDDAKYRTLRAQKNRFGAVNEIGVFAMTDKGIRQVANPSAIFMSHNSEPKMGSAIAVIHEGSRQLLVEIQALVDTHTTTNPGRVSVGLDSSRMALLLAVLNCHCSLPLANSNVFLNIVGGLRVEETGIDLACMLALVSVITKRILPSKLAAFGEIGLSGEIRPSPYGHERIKTAFRQGISKILIPKANDPKNSLKDKGILRVATIGEALKLAFEKASLGDVQS